jgi:hypothetical protein
MECGRRTSEDSDGFFEEMEETGDILITACDCSTGSVMASVRLNKVNRHGHPTATFLSCLN